MKLNWLIFAIIASSCSGSLGDRVEGGNFSVYYLETKDRSMATKIAHYFRDHDLLTGRKQDVRLERKGKKYLLKLIVNEGESGKNLSVEEMNVLLRLEQDLSTSVCDGCDLHLVLSDSKFENGYTINP